MHYGLTEGGSISSVSAPGSSPEILTETIGWPDHDHQYRVLTVAGAAARAGEIGEVQVRGAGVMIGYYRDPDATRATFTADGWLRTADLVECRPDGAWRFVGRSGDMFKSGGYNVYPREVEIALEECPAIAAAAVIGVPDRTFDEVGWAFVVPAAGAFVDEARLKAHAAGLLANYKIPKRFLVVDELPVLAVGKVDKRQLKARAMAMANGNGVG
jgi:acyl-CoA synthetase (AMP-forming)/AMP-acid ligase II